MKQIALGLLFLVAVTVASAQVAEFGISGGVSRLSNNDLGNSYTLGNGFRLAFRGTFNTYRHFGFEVGYAYNRTNLEYSGSSSGTAIHQGFFNALAYATPEGSRVRPFATAGVGFSNFVIPGYSASYGGQTKFGYNVGGGIKAKISSLFGVRFDVRRYDTGKPWDLGGSGMLHQMEMSAGPYVHF